MTTVLRVKFLRQSWTGSRAKWRNKNLLGPEWTEERWNQLWRCQ